MEKIRISKRDMKKNDLAEIISKIKIAIENNKNRIKPFLIGFAVAIVLIVGIIAVIKNKKSNANELYVSALEKYSNAAFTANSNFDQSIAEFEKAYGTYTGSNQAKIILLNIADAYYRKKDYDKAVLNYDKFLKSNSDSRFEVLGLLGKAMALSQQKKRDEALNILEGLIKNPDADYIKADAIVQIAIIYEIDGKTDKAVENLNMIINDEQYKESNWKLYAEYLALYMKQKKNYPAVNYDLATSIENNMQNVQNSIFSNALNKTIQDTSAVVQPAQTK